MNTDISKDIRETFSEEYVFSVMHVFVPAIIYIYLDTLLSKNKVLWFIIVVYVFESVEYLIFGTPLVRETFHETPVDSLINDIVMAMLGLWSALVIITGIFNVVPA